jgi:PAS domain S-box-containing protein
MAKNTPDKHKLSQNEEFLYFVLDSINEAIFIDDAVTKKIIYVNQTTCDMYGYSREEILKMNIGELSAGTYPYTQQEAVKYLGKAVTEGPQIFEWLARHRDGNTFWVEVNIRYAEIGKDERFFVSVRDINHRKIAEKKIQEAETEKSLILSSVADLVVFYKTPELIIEWTNNAAADSLDTNLNSIIGKKCYKLWHNRKTPCEKCPVARAFETGQFEQEEVQSPDGRHWSLKATPVINDKGEIAGVVEVARDITENKKYRTDLEKRNEFIQAILDNLPIGLAVNEFDSGKASYMNPKFSEIYGYPPEIITDIQSFFENVYPDPEYRKEIISKILGDIQSGDPERMRWDNVKITTKEGETKYVSAKNIPITEQNVMVSTVIDVTNRKVAEDNLEKQKKFLENLMGNLPGMVYRCKNDKNWTMEYINGACREITGYEADDFIGNKKISFNDIISKKDRKRLWDKWQEVLAEKEPFRDEYEIVAADGSTRWVWEQGIGIYDENGNVVVLEGFISDITERKLMEIALAESEQKYRDLIERANDGIVVLQDRVIKLANRKFAELVGYKTDNIIGKDFFRFINNKDVDYFSEIYKKRIDGNDDTHIYEINLVHKNRSLVATEFNGTVINYEGKPADFVFVRDIRERNQYIEKLREKNKELEQIIYVASHDLRTPLVNIQGFAKELNISLSELYEILQEENIPEYLQNVIREKIEKDINVATGYILKSITKMDNLLYGLLKLSRLGRAALNIEKLDMNRLCNEVINSFKYLIDEKKIVVTIENLPQCYGDYVQVTQIFTNLIDNAIKYSKENIIPEIKISGKKKDDSSVYSVKDNGVGIYKKDYHKIFEIFNRLTQNKVSGEGIGLSIVNKIVSRHNGAIWVDSIPGEGSVFFVALPAKLTSNIKEERL